MGNNKGNILLLIIVLIGIGITSLTIRNSNESRVTKKPDTFQQKPFISTPQQFNEGKTETDGLRSDGLDEIKNEIVKAQKELDEVQVELDKIKKYGESSPYEGMVTIQRTTSGLIKTNPEEEYLILKASWQNDEKVIITGWKLESALTGKRGTVGGASYLPNSGGVNVETAIQLNPGAQVIVTTGRSPIGSSFRTNTCTGYFEQFQNFNPRLKTFCPRPSDELENFGTVPFYDDSCYNYVNRIPQCTMVITEMPLLSSNCVNFINDTAHYSGCVQNHRGDNDFFENEWRIYLGRNEEMWRTKRELIKLLDEDGKTVDAFTY